MDTLNVTAENIIKGNPKSLARAITLVENESAEGEKILQSLNIIRRIPVVGITGPPGAGKSTLLNALIRELTDSKKKVAVVAVDPTSPFNLGALLGDRIRWAEHFNSSNVFIRSLATRGSLGGLTDKIIEVVDVLRAADFDYIFIETVGVGQSEVEIAGLADTTLVVLVPEAGDEIQAMKAGLMEIADIFVVNKSDREDADRFVKNLKTLVHSRPVDRWLTPVVKTIATQNEGAAEVIKQINRHNNSNDSNPRKHLLLAEKAWKLIQKEKMKSIDRYAFAEELKKQMNEKEFNLYRFVKNYI